jgi:hypothetical protein
MKTMNTVQPGFQISHAGGPQNTSGLSVIGWLIVGFSVIPLAMLAGGDGGIYGLIGLVMLAIGLGFVLIGRITNGRRGNDGGSAAVRP